MAERIPRPDVVVAQLQQLVQNDIFDDTALTTYMQREAPPSGNHTTDLANVTNIFQTHFEFAKVPAGILAGAFLAAFPRACACEEAMSEEGEREWLTTAIVSPDTMCVSRGTSSKNKNTHNFKLK